MTTGGASTQSLFLLRRPTEVREDGYTSTYRPFLITYDGRDLYAAFTDAALAAYFVSALRLEVQYQAVPLTETPPSDLMDANSTNTATEVAD